VEYNTLWLENEVEFPADFDDLAEPDRQEVEVAGRAYWIPVFSESPMTGVPASTGTGATVQEAGPRAGGRGPSRGSGRGGRKAAASDGTVKAPMQGTIIKVNVEPGQAVAAGEVLFVLEAMKMENPIPAPMAGVVGEVDVAEGSTIAAGVLLTRLQKQEVPA
jgi:acetyl-CoA/propionyl-CoA carboxylase, biotin carboxylase, biotin carboxyl carrier protein